MGSKIFDMPRHKRPMWEVYAFAAALIGLVGLALTRTAAEKTLAVQPAAEVPATAGFAAP